MSCHSHLQQQNWWQTGSQDAGRHLVFLPVKLYMILQENCDEDYYKGKQRQDTQKLLPGKRSFQGQSCQ